MNPLEREQMKSRARAKLVAMRERAVRLRKRALAGAAIGFVVIWAAIFGQMITGNDPALGPAAANVRTAAEESVASDPERRLSRTAAGDEDEGQLEAAQLEELEAVTTGQS